MNQFTAVRKAVEKVYNSNEVDITTDIVEMAKKSGDSYKELSKYDESFVFSPFSKYSEYEDVAGEYGNDEQDTDFVYDVWIKTLKDNGNYPNLVKALKDEKEDGI